jgi:hypothetical protein
MNSIYFLDTMWLHLVTSATVMRNKQRQKPQSNIPRQVRMPPAIDQWLEIEASKSIPGTTVADKIREIVGAAYKASTQARAA